MFVKAAGLLRQRRPDIDLEMTILGSLSGAKDFNLQHIVEDAEMADVVTHRPPVVAPELASWFRFGRRRGDALLQRVLRFGGLGSTGVRHSGGGHQGGRSFPRHLRRPDRDAGGRTRPLRLGRRPGGSLRRSATREDMGRVAATHAETFGWHRTAAITLESYHAVGVAGPTLVRHPRFRRPFRRKNPSGAATRKEGQRCLKSPERS